MKIVITGGPHSGKTTLIAALSEYGITVPEPAARVIRRERLLSENSRYYEPTYPWNDYPAFCPKVMIESVRLESRLNDDPEEFFFLDRSLIDTLAYARLNGEVKLVQDEHIEDWIDHANYSEAFICDPVGEYTATDIRSETEEEAKRTHSIIRQTYEEYLPPTTLPAVPVEERVNIILRRLKLI